MEWSSAILSRRAFNITLSGLVGACATQSSGNNQGGGNMNAAKPIIIAHRGASGYRPEHTIGAYRLAIEMGADYIEPDLVLTKDNHLVCRHENEISQTTNVAQKPEFAARKVRKTIDGETLEGWFTEDFTLAELKTLRAIERLPQLRPKNRDYDGQETIPTFQEVLELRAQKSIEKGRQIGVYPETKHPSYFATLGLLFDNAFLDALEKANLNTKSSPVFIQSFETQNLKLLARKTEVNLIQLINDEGGAWNSQSAPDINYAAMTTKAGLAEIAKYAQGIGPFKGLIVPRDDLGNSIAPTSLIKDAHDVGLKVHPWTFRAENNFLPKELQIGDRASPIFRGLHGNLNAEIKMFIALGVDGFFTDFADIGFAAVNN